MKKNLMKYETVIDFHSRTITRMETNNGWVVIITDFDGEGTSGLTSVFVPDTDKQWVLEKDKD